jgi:hypothetical protein
VKHLKHPATIIAAVALFVAFGGGAAAYASGLINGSQIKNHSIPAKKLTASAVASLRGKRGPAGPAGPTGAQGPQGIQGTQGIQGIQGPIGPSSAASSYDSGGSSLTTDAEVVGTLTLAAGNYVVMANTTLYDNTDASNTILCWLNDSNAGEFDRTYSQTGSAANHQVSVSMVGPLTSTGSTVTANCNSANPSNTQAFYTHVTAIKVGSVAGTLGRFSAPRTLSPKASN